MEMVSLLGVFLLCSLPFSGQAVITVDLTGTWDVINSEKGISVKGQVPGSMYTALMNSKVIPDPYYRDNDDKLRWVASADWAFSNTFQLDASVLNKKFLILVCEGLDTYAGPYINNQLVGVAFNMFQRYTYDVSRALQPGLNHIVVFFKSPVVQAATLAGYLPYPVPPTCPPAVQHGECHINMLRKVQCAFGWDWGPSFPTQGIWKSIYINAFNTAVMYGLTALPKKASDGSWSLSVEVAFDAPSEQPVSGTLTLSLGGVGIKSVATVAVSSTNKIVRSTLSIPQDHQVELWWPNGYGKQTLYPLTAVFVSDDHSDVSNRSINVGFRTVELIQDPVSSNPSQGKTFYFKINGVPVFLKGTNWIPPDSFQERITRTKVEQLLKSAADVHANAIRINGVGVYESEDFYDLADQYGLMVWQDLMYCDAMYPSSQDFLDSVTTELDYQLARIKHHPCIIIWSANNENEEALRYDWYKVKSNYQRYYKDYVALYETTIMPLVKAADDTRPFVPSCPSNGDQSIQEGFVATDPDSELWGDKHYYNYSANLWDPNPLPVPRMMTEYGSQAWCSLGSLEAVFAPEDLDYWSSMADHRQHHPDGNPQMLAEVLMHFNMPPTEDKKQKFADLIYLTQINQAMSIRTETEHYRRWQSRLGSDGRGLTMGALYWQLNDIWQAPTWASIEYSGKWKMLHYYVQHFLAPILVSPFVDASGNLDIYVVVDEILVESVRDPHTRTLQFRPLTRVDGAGFVGSAKKEVRHLLQKTSKAIQGELTLNVFSWSSFQPLKTWTIPYKLNSTAQSVFRRPVAALLREAGCPDAASCLVTAASSAAPLAPTWLPLARLKQARGLAKANITVTQVQQTSPMEFRVTLGSDHVAPFVWLDAGPLPGRFGDNGFLMTSATHSVTFQAWAPTQTSTLQQSLSVLSLMDIYDRAK